MTEIKLVEMTRDLSIGSLSSGVPSIDNRWKEAYCITVYKQGLAYNIVANGILVGSCLIRLTCIEDENAEYYVENPTYSAFVIDYIAVDRRLQKRGIGTKALQLLIYKIKSFCASLPVRFLILYAFPEKVSWYQQCGFRAFLQPRDARYPDLVPMRMDFIDWVQLERYTQSMEECLDEQ